MRGRFAAGWASPGSDTMNTARNTIRTAGMHVEVSMNLARLETRYRRLKALNG